jgi:predicted transcriptional regulator
MDLKRLFENRVCRNIIRFFHENQSSVDTPRGIATWIKEEREEVKKALDTLVEAGVLVSHEVSSTTGYSYTRNKRTIEEIGKQLKKERH